MSDDEIDLAFDDFDVEIKSVDGGDEPRDATDDEDEVDIDDLEEDEDAGKKTNSLFRGPYDHVKYKFLEQKKVKERLVVPPEERRTSHRLSMAEKTNLIGIRASHIEKGAPIYVDIDNITDILDIAKKELREKKFPFLLERKINDFEVEYWDPNKMTIEW